MKLYLKNFRCYHEKTFDFSNGSMILISGCSGIGKTTILMAINFALFGTGTKLVSHSKTSCMVTLEFDDIKITRTKRPNRVVVNDVYEDDAAQEIINKKFGEHFPNIGYVSQNSVNSFILMSPIEKLGFLERFAFKDIDLETIKIRCKAHIDRTKDELTSITSKLDMSRQFLDKETKPELVKFPIKCKPDQYEKVIKNENVGYKNAQILIKKENKLISQLKDEINDIKVLEATTSSKQELINSINKKLYDNNNILENISIKNENEIEEYKNILEYIVSQRNFVNIEKEYNKNKLKLEELKTDELAKLKEKIDNITSNLWTEYNKDEIKDEITNRKDCIENLEKLKKLKVELKKYCDISLENLTKLKSDLESNTAKLEQKTVEKHKVYEQYMKEKELYHCPSCNVSLKLVSDGLELVKDVNSDFKNNSNTYSEEDIETLDNEVKTLKTIVTKLQKNVTDIENKLDKKLELEKEIQKIVEEYDDNQDVEELKSDLEYLYSYYSEQTANEKKLKVLKESYEKEELSGTYNNFKKQVDSLEKEYNKLSGKLNTNNLTKLDTNLSEEEIHNIISENQINKNKYDSIVKQITDLELDKKKYETIISKANNSHISKYETVKDIKDIENELEKCDEKITEYIQKQEKHETNLKQIKMWEQYQKDIKKYNELVEKVNNLEYEEKECRNRYASATMLKEKILEAESISMLNVIDSINTHSQLYLEYFFPENPISVRLLPFKETKKSTKPQINVEIEYKGMEVDLTSLSSGELSRVTLAFTLALAEMFNTPLLLLDECTASLDEQTTNVVFENIREHFHGKLSLVVAHQVVSGTFDNVLKL